MVSINWSMMGFETEYAIGDPTATGDTPTVQYLALEHYIRTLMELNPSCPAIQGSGVFLGNGARAYIDSGIHPEYATPECMTPDEVVANVLAGDEIYANVVRRLRNTIGGLKGLSLFKGNVSYSKGIESADCATTWAAHENYLTIRPIKEIARDFIPHLLTRVIYAGGGGLDPFHPGIKLILSPRAMFFRTECSRDTTTIRGIFNTRSEPLAKGAYQRLHVICGDSLCSQLSIWLKAATTALVVRLIEQGISPLDGKSFDNPVKTLHRFASDPALVEIARFKRGNGSISALEVQKRYLECAEAHLEKPFMPEWAGLACERWRDVLQRLETMGRDGVHDRLDWAIRHRLLEFQVKREGVDLSLFKKSNRVLSRILKWVLDRNAASGVTLKMIQATRGPIARRVKAILGEDGHEGVTRDELIRVLIARGRLCELDMKIAQLVPAGIFEQIESILEHRVIPDEQITHAARQAPRTTRACLRGDLVISHVNDGGIVADWTEVRAEDGRFIDLSDPLETKVKWITASDEAELKSERPIRFESPLHRALKRGDLGAILRLTRDVETVEVPPEIDRTIAMRMCIRARSHMRQGRFTKGRALSDQARSLLVSPERIVVEAMACQRLNGLVPERSGPLELLIRGNTQPTSSLLAYRLDVAQICSQVLFHDEARIILERQLAVPCASTWVRLRLRTDLAELYRRMGNMEAAGRHLESAWREAATVQNQAQVADGLLLTAARICGDRSHALALLRRAAMTLRRLGHWVAECRAHLLDARISPVPAVARRRLLIIQSYLDVSPELASCRRMSSIIDNWDEWVSGAPDPLGSEDEFWLV